MAFRNSRPKPPRPPQCPERFRATVHGTCFGDRPRQLEAVRAGDELVLIPDPPLDKAPGIWVHRLSGDPIGHLPPEIERWLAPWLLRGGSARARAVRVEGPEAPSWRRLLIEVTCA